jgi:hypothetical protein
MGRNKLPLEEKLKTTSVSMAPNEIETAQLLASNRGWSLADVLRYCTRIGLQVIANDEFDYPAFIKNNPPDPAKIRRGIAAREQRVEAVMQQRAVRVESEILAQFQEITVPDQNAEQIINQALREWLSAKDLKEMIRGELQEAVQQAFIQAGAGASQSGKK